MREEITPAGCMFVSMGMGSIIQVRMASAYVSIRTLKATFSRFVVHLASGRHISAHACIRQRSVTTFAVTHKLDATFRTGGSQCGCGESKGKQQP